MTLMTLERKHHSSNIFVGSFSSS